MNRVVLICPYFGKFPSYFDLWLMSAAKNPEIDFMLITDIEINVPLSENIKIHRESFEHVRKRIISMFENDVPKIKIDKPYKLCDYKTAYGQIFHDLIENYEFWGYNDIDVILGRIRDVLTDDILDSYNKFYIEGHLTIYRNEDWINEVYKKKFPGYVSYKDVYSTMIPAHFDENHFIVKDSLTGLKTYFDWDYYSPRSEEFRFLCGKEKYASVCRWDASGRLLHYIDTGTEVKENEIIYIHLQKREMPKFTSCPEDGFMITPEGFEDISVDKIDSEYIQRKIRRN